jgi:ABC-type cobalt transport system substrate-binding protein
MTYTKFTGIAEARNFAAQLMRGSKHFSVTVTTSGAGKNSRCIITKTRKHYEEMNQPFFTSKGELESLVKLRERLGQENLKTKRVTADEVSVIPSPKRSKVEKK